MESALLLPNAQRWKPVLLTFVNEECALLRKVVSFYRVDLFGFIGSYADFLSVFCILKNNFAFKHFDIMLQLGPSLLGIGCRDYDLKRAVLKNGDPVQGLGRSSLKSMCA